VGEATPPSTYNRVWFSEGTYKASIPLCAELEVVLPSKPHLQGKGSHALENWQYFHRHTHEQNHDKTAADCPWETFLKRRFALALAVLTLSATVLWSNSSAATSGQQAPTLIACLQNHEFRYFSRPATCAVFARQYYPDGRLQRFRDIGGRHLKWNNWGEHVSIGVGKYELPSYSLTVRAFDRVHCANGRWYYGKVVIRGLPGGGKGGFHLRLARCGHRRFSPFRSAGQSSS
jgi:hypothetical protein